MCLLPEELPPYTITSNTTLASTFAYSMLELYCAINCDAYASSKDFPVMAMRNAKRGRSAYDNRGAFNDSVDFEYVLVLGLL